MAGLRLTSSFRTKDSLLQNTECDMQLLVTHLHLSDI